MPTVGNEITDLDIRAVPGQGDSITLINLLSLTSTTIDQWTAKAGAGLGLSLTVTASGDDVVVSWSDAQATTIIGRPWRLRLSGHDKFGGRVVEARPQATPGDQTVTVTMADPAEVTVEVSGVAVGAVDSVNGETGVVTLSAADVGADPTGTASTAVSSHAAAVDPHGDRAYADAELAAYKPAIPHIEWTVSQPGGTGSPWRIIIPAPLRSAVYVPSAAVAATPPTGDFDGVEVEAPSNPEVSWSVVLPASAGGGLIGVYDPADHTTATGLLLLPSSTWTLAASETGWTPIAMVAQHHQVSGNIWIGLAPPDAVVVEAALADKEDAGVAQSLIDGLPVLTAGPGIDVDTDTPGESIVSATALALTPTAALASSTAETSLLTAPLTIPGPFTYASMGIFRLNVSLTNKTGSSQNVTYRIKLNGTTAATFTWTAVPTSATSRLMLGDFSITFSSFLGNPVVAIGGWAMLGAAGTGLVFGTAVAPASVTFVTLANDLTLDVTAQLGSSSSNLNTVLGSSSVQLRTLV